MENSDDSSTAIGRNTLVQRIRAVAHDFGTDEGRRRPTKLPEGFVMLFTDEMEPIEPANFFLLDRCWPPKKRRKGRWENTQAAYADDLAHWWVYLMWTNQAWDQVTDDDIKDYAGLLNDYVSTGTSRPLKPSTIKRRVGRAIEVYRWASQHGLIGEPLFSIASSASRPLDAIVSAVGPSGEDILPDDDSPDETIHPFSAPDLQSVLAKLGPSPYRFLAKLRPQYRFLAKPSPSPGVLDLTRDRLVAETSLLTGMRLFETIGVSVMDLFSMERQADIDDPWKEVVLWIRGKGGKRRQVFFPSILVLALLNYYNTERSSVVERAEALSKVKGEAYQQPRALFLNGLASNPNDLGKPLRDHTVTTGFTTAVKACGLLRKEPGYEIDPMTGSPSICPHTGTRIPQWTEVAAHTFHDLRHTFALNFYLAEIADGNSSPWLQLKARLGHSRVSTTMDIYLQHVRHREPQISDGMSAFYKDVIDGR